tara:strand:+ start:2006 stop:2416 length:411 start_codon:yes stop_codon:yes gene_type:complete
MSSLGGPFELPNTRLPTPNTIGTPTLLIPKADIPSYKPIVIPPSDLKRPEGTQGEKTTEAQEPPSLTIPVLDIPIPMPTTEVVMAATYAAVSAVAVTTFAQPLFDSIKKKLTKFLQGKVNKWKEKKEARNLTSSPE